MRILWGTPRIHGELLKLGFDVSERTISRYLRRRSPSDDARKRWNAFLRNHRDVIAAMDFLTVPTLTFITTTIARTTVLRRTRRRHGPLRPSRRRQPAWSHTLGWAGCITDTTGSRLPEEIVRMRLGLCHTKRPVSVPQP